MQHAHFHPPVAQMANQVQAQALGLGIWGEGYVESAWPPIPASLPSVPSDVSCADLVKRLRGVEVTGYLERVWDGSSGKLVIYPAGLPDLAKGTAPESYIVTSHLTAIKCPAYREV